MSKLRFLIALLALGIAAPAWPQAVDPFSIPAGKCDPSKGHCVSAIVFSSTRKNVGAVADEIYLMTMHEDGTFNDDEFVQLTENEVGVHGFVGANGFAKPSPDGKWIVFDSNRNRNPDRTPLPPEPLNTSDLFVMKADGNDQTVVIRGSSATWSPNGKYIAFHRSASGDACPVFNPPPFPGIPGCPIKIDPGAATWDSDIFIMRVPDLDADVIEEPINITNTLMFIEDDTDWSPDGQKIVFTRHPVTDNVNNSNHAEIWVLNLETGIEERLTTNDEEERAPAWSPNGTQIVYMCRMGDPAMPGGPATFEICVMNADGTDQTRLTINTMFDATPSWSPDGTKIIFQRGMPTVAQLWLMNPDGTDQTQLTPHSSSTLGANASASWGQLWVGGGGPQ